MTSHPATPRNLPVAEVAAQLGLTPGRKGTWGPCPACNATVRSESLKDKRGPIGIRDDGIGWKCQHCRVTGDAIDLISLRLLGRRGRDAGADFAQVLAWLSDRRVVPVDDHDVEPPAPRAAPPDALTELRQVLAACRRPDAVPEAAAYLRSRAIDPATCPAGVLPASFVAQVVTSTNDDGKPRVWWPSGWSRRWPLVVPAVDHEGVVRSLHARHVPGYGPADDPQQDGQPARKTRKSTWPRDLPASGLFFAGPCTTRPWLRGRGHPPARVLVAEGITDFLTLACTTLPDVGVLGIESGSASAFARLPWAPGQAVYLAPHPDGAGARYLEAILDVLPPFVTARVVPLHRVLPRAAHGSEVTA